MDVDILDRSRERMNKTIEALKRELSGMKAGRANPQILDRIMVDYYGTVSYTHLVDRVLEMLKGGETNG